MRIAHLSDLHLLDLTGAFPGRLLNKRATGYANIKLKRGHSHKPAPVLAAMRGMRELGVDHVVITGDVTNLALEREFDRVRDALENELGYSPDQVSIVPGNHDVYTRGSVAKKRFINWFAEYITSDLPELTAEGDVFPFVRLRGPAAIIGISTAVARLPFVASGRIGRPQLAALERMLAHPEVRSRTPVILQHHPVHNPGSLTKTLLEGLVDADDEIRALRGTLRGLILHGHLHRRMCRPLRTPTGELHAVGATSASLLHEDPHKMAGFNVYEIDDSGAIGDISAQRWHPASSAFQVAAVPS